jgi:hypothetical protein
MDSATATSPPHRQDRNPPAYVNVVTYVGTAVFVLGALLVFYSDTWAGH